MHKYGMQSTHPANLGESGNSFLFLIRNITHLSTKLLSIIFIYTARKSSLEVFV